MKKRLLILGGSEFQIPLLLEAKKMGLYTILVDISENCFAKEYADEFIKCSIKDTDKICEIAKKIMPVGITVGMCDVAVKSAAKACHELRLSGLSINAAENSTDKFKMIKVFEKNHVPHPKYFYINNPKELENKNFDYPIIIKPTDMAGSRGISLVNSIDELHEALNYSMNSSDSRNVIIEEYMIGPEVSVEIIVLNNVAKVIQVTDKLTSGAPHFMEIGHTQPSKLPNDIVDRIKEVACRAAEALELGNSLAHAEIIVTKDGPKMVEIGARMGGDGIQEQLTLLSTGISIPRISILLAIGEKVAFPIASFNKGSAIRFIQSHEGRIYKITDNTDNSVTKKIYCKVGDFCSEAKDNSGRLGYVIAQGNSNVEAAMKCDDSLKNIIIDIQTEVVKNDKILITNAQECEYNEYYKMKCDDSDMYWNSYSDKPNYNRLKNIFKTRLWPVNLRVEGSKKLFFIKSLNNDYYGYILLMNKNNRLEIGISVKEEYQGKNIGSESIDLIKKIISDYGFVAYSRIRDDNYASQKIFIKNGFKKTNITEIADDPIKGKIIMREYIY